MQKWRWKNTKQQFKARPFEKLKYIVSILNVSILFLLYSELSHCADIIQRVKTWFLRKDKSVPYFY